MASSMALKCRNIIKSNYKFLYSRSLTTTSIKRNDDKKELKETVVEKPLYATASAYRDSQSKNKFRGSDDNSRGTKPTNFQKRMMVLTGMYKSKDDIPEYVTSGTMVKFSDRLRIAFILVGCLVFFALAFLGERITASRIDRDKKMGVVVTKM
uniref:Essential MCU regulator, mitochondrial n=1 Tax=Strongyloides papillosus TaxID=174720 RepID=A0A0N5C2Z3_STREA